MTVQYLLREEAAELDRSEERLTGDIEDAEERIVKLRRKRDDVRFHRAEVLAAANFLDNASFKVERDTSGLVTVSIDPALAAASTEAGEDG